VATHLECLQCHDVFSGGVKNEVWDRGDYRAGLCFSCHEEQRRAFALNEAHSLLRRTVRCRECHPPHEEFAANLTLESLELGGERILLAYDPVAGNPLCLKCHSYLDVTGPRSGFSFPAGFNLHELHLLRTYAACVECHAPHGATGRHLLRDTTLEGNPLLHFSLAEGGTCTVECHGRQHRGTSYVRGGI